MHAPWVVHARVAKHHPETVVERYGDADPVLRGVAAGLADEEAVVENVVVSERGALRKPGRAACVLNVDGIVELESRGQRNVLIARRELLPLGRVEEHHPPEPWTPRGNLIDHARVV